MNDFMTWENLATFAGCTTGVAVITQFIKNIGILKKLPTQWASYFLAVALLFGATYFTGTLTPQMASLIPFNAAIVSIAANGAYSAIDRVNQFNASQIEKSTSSGATNFATTVSNALEQKSDADVKVTEDTAKASTASPETSEADSKVVIG
jgi:ABC-type iron transport system FetAB permease component